MGVGARMIAVAMAGLSAGCTPTFDWREVRPAEGLLALFPCRPQSHVRQVPLDGSPVEMLLLSCTAGGSTFAVSRVVVDGTQADRTMQAMQDALVANLSSGVVPAGQGAGQASSTGPGRLGGQRLDIQGHGPQGQPLQARGEFFSRDGAIFQATVVGARQDPEAVDFFFSSIELR